MGRTRYIEYRSGRSEPPRGDDRRKPGDHVRFSKAVSVGFAVKLSGTPKEAHGGEKHVFEGDEHGRVVSMVR